MWHINYISYLSNFCNNLKQAKKALVEFDDTINKLNAGLTEGLTLNKYKSSDEDIDARKKKARCRRKLAKDRAICNGGRRCQGNGC